MKRKNIFGILIIVFSVLLLGCSNETINSFKNDNEHLANRVLELEEELTQKNDEINHLKGSISKLRVEKNELKNNLKMIRFSSESRLNDINDAFYNLKNIYNIGSKYTIKDDWYALNEEYFKIELIEYKDAKKVDFYLLRMESDYDEILIFTDNDSKDGWIYENYKINEIIDEHRKSLSGDFSYESYFVLYTKVTLEDGNVIQTPKLPVYYE